MIVWHGRCTPAHPVFPGKIVSLEVPAVNRLLFTCFTRTGKSSVPLPIAQPKGSFFMTKARWTGLLTSFGRHGPASNVRCIESMGILASRAGTRALFGVVFRVSRTCRDWRDGKSLLRLSAMHVTDLGARTWYASTRIENLPLRRSHTQAVHSRCTNKKGSPSGSKFFHRWDSKLQGTVCNVLVRCPA